MRRSATASQVRLTLCSARSPVAPLSVPGGRSPEQVPGRARVKSTVRGLQAEALVAGGAELWRKTAPAPGTGLLHL